MNNLTNKRKHCYTTKRIKLNLANVQNTHTCAQSNVIVAIDIAVADTQTDLMITILVRWNQRR